MKTQKSRLPDVTKSLEYQAGYYHRRKLSGKAKEARDKYRKTEKGKESVKKYNEQANRARVSREKLANEMVSKGEVKCMDCGMVFEKICAEAGGFKFFRNRPYSGICGKCQEDET